MVIELRRAGVFWVAGVVGLAILFALGYVVSPRDAEGQPVLLSPGVRALENYRRSLAGWAENWESLQTELQRITTAKSDLLTASQAAQRAFEQSLALSQAVDASETPASLIGLHDQAALTAQTFVDASLAVAAWLSAPSADHEAAAAELLTRARQALADLESNGWLQKPY